MAFLGGLFETKATSTKKGQQSFPDSIARATGAVTGVQTKQPLGNAGQWDAEQAVRRGYEQVIWIFRCVDVIAQNQASRTIRLREGLDRRKGKWIDDDDLYRLLNFRANSYESSWQLRYRVSSQACLSRRGAFIEIVRTKATKAPAELHLLPVGRTKPIPDSEKFVSGFEVTRSDNKIDVLPPEDVIWVRNKPHPIDPYMQMTPLVAAGIEADTDYLARVFNRTFLMNDGRPGMLITIDPGEAPLPAEDAEIIKRRFSGGPASAGQTTVIEAAGISAQDLSASPRDIQWDSLLNTSKERLLMAFGVPESVMGNAANRTFDNADAERENFWMDTMIPHCDNMAFSLDALTGDTSDTKVIAFDYDDVDVLQRAAARRREEWRTEYNAGLITADQYLEETGRDPWAVGRTEVLYMPNGVVVARNDVKQKEADKFVPAQQAQQGAVGGRSETSGEAAMSGRIRALDRATAKWGNQIAARLASGKGIESTETKSAKSTCKYCDAPSTRYVVNSKNGAKTAVCKGHLKMGKQRTARSGPGKRANPNLVARVEKKEEEHDRALEYFIEGAVASWDERQANVFPSRLDHTKVRKDTRHWEGSIGTKAIDPSYVVDEQQWRDELLSVIEGAITKNVNSVVSKEMRVLKAQGITPSIDLVSLKQQVISDVLNYVALAANSAMARTRQKIADMDNNGSTLAEIKAQVTKDIGARSSWRKTLAASVTTKAREMSKASLHGSVGEEPTVYWHTSHDERVRASHRSLDGRKRPKTGHWTVAGGTLRYPHDPQAPIHETINCRCWVTYHYL